MDFLAELRSGALVRNRTPPAVFKMALPRLGRPSEYRAPSPADAATL